jgi:hypothetical protein
MVWTLAPLDIDISNVSHDRLHGFQGAAAHVCCSPRILKVLRLKELPHLSRQLVETPKAPGIYRDDSSEAIW